MKTVSFLPLIIAFTLTATTNSLAADKRYLVKSGYVKYQLSGQNTGTDELYWDEFGQKEARYSDMTVNIMGFRQTVKNVTIIDGDWSYSLDPNGRDATRVNHKEMMQKMTDNPRQTLSYSEDTLKSLGAQKIGKDKILGKTTILWEIPKFGMKVWEYNGIPLKSEANMMGFQMNMDAVEFKENIKIDQAKLQLPPNLNIKDEVMTDEDYAQSQEALKKMHELQNDPEYQEAMKMMQNMQISPAMQDDIKKAQELQTTQKQESFTEQTADGVKNNAEKAAQESVNEATRTGVKKAMGGLLKSLF